LAGYSHHTENTADIKMLLVTAVVSQVTKASSLAGRYLYRNTLPSLQQRNDGCIFFQYISTYQPGYNVSWDATWTFSTTKTSNLNLQLFKFMLYSGRGKLHTISALNKRCL